MRAACATTLSRGRQSAKASGRSPDSVSWTLAIACVLSPTTFPVGVRWPFVSATSRINTVARPCGILTRFPILLEPAFEAPEVNHDVKRAILQKQQTNMRFQAASNHPPPLRALVSRAVGL